MEDPNYLYFQIIVSYSNSLVSRRDTNAWSQKKQNNFLDNVRRRLTSIINSLHLTPRLFLVREYSRELQVAKDKDLEFLHAHVIIAIERINYREGFEESFRFDDSLDSGRKIKLKCYRIDNETKIRDLDNFTNYVLKGINSNSQYFIDYQFTSSYPNCEELRSLINQKKMIQNDI